METPIRFPLIDDSGWEHLLPFLPPDLDQSARRYGALRRRREIPDATTLLRLLLAYASGPSLKDVAQRATDLGWVAHLSDNALDVKLGHAVPWLGYLVGQCLAGPQTAFPWHVPLRVRLLDASCLPRPGATGADWRLHLGLDLRTGLIDHLSVTGDNIGESFTELPVDPGDLVIADRGYATRAGIAALVARQAEVLVRITWQNLPLQHPAGQPFALGEALDTLPPGTIGQWDVQLVPTRTCPAVTGRLVVYALSEEQAAQARRRVRQAARTNGKTPTAETLQAAGFVLLFTTVAADVLTPAQVLALYRLRWQVEITFKRSKSALHLADFRTQTDHGCYAVLLAKCLLLLLTDTLAWATGLFSPSGDAAAADEPLSLLPGLVCDALPDSAPAPDADGLVWVAAGLADDLFYGTSAPTGLPS